MARVSEWVLGIVGAIAAFLGLFILYAGEGQYLGFGGSTWRVGDIATAWGYGLLIGGVALLVVAVVVAVRASRHPKAHRPRSELAGLMTHVAIFAVVNALLWIEDIATGGGLEYAYWVTIPWGIGLFAHVVAYVVGARPVLRHH
jgi:hypothetical protein